MQRIGSPHCTVILTAGRLAAISAAARASRTVVAVAGAVTQVKDGTACQGAGQDRH
ncbi:MAG: hypothetical protein ACTHM4_08055 [Rhodanobacteraceae bacterium]|jgi:hypothetical protein